MTTATPSPAKAGPFDDATSPAAPLHGPPVDEPAGRSRLWLRARSAAERYALVALTIGVFIFFAVWSRTSDTFLTTTNLSNVVGDQTPLVLLALASLFPLIVGEFDLSVGAVATVSQMAVAGLAALAGAPLPVALLAGLAIGAAVGLVNALLVTRIGVNGIITTLGIATLLAGLLTLTSHSKNIVQGIPTAITSLGTDTVAGVPTLALLMLLLGGAVAYVLSSTPRGRHLQVIGSNRSAADLVGINVQRNLALTFVLSGSLAAVAGVALLARTGIASPQSGGTPLMLQALSAVFLGATTIRPGRFNVPGTFVAVFFIAFSVSGLSLAGAADWVNDVFTGAALVLAVAFSTLLGRRRRGATS